MPEDNTGVPVIDLSSFADGGSESDRADVAKNLRDAAENVGFFYIKGHGFPKQVHSDMFKLTKEFFELSEDAKMDLEARKNPLYRGYNNVETGAHTCTPDDAAEHPPDLKESFTIGAEPTKTMTSPMHGPNQWPSEKQCAEFEPTVRKYWESLTTTVAPRLMHALALSLDLPVDFFQSKATHPHSQMVLLKYPPNNGKVRRGCGAHTDCGFLTILTQDEDGLEVKRKDGTWVAAPVIPDTFVVNIGDMLAHWTNDRYKSTEHRVSNFSETKTRYSIPFFFAVDYNTRVATIDSCRDFRNGVVYEPCISGEYILGKLGLMHLAEVGSESTEESIKRDREEKDTKVQEPESGADDDEHPAKRAKATTE